MCLTDKLPRSSLLIVKTKEKSRYSVLDYASIEAWLLNSYSIVTYIYRMATHQSIQLVALDMRKLSRSSSKKGLMWKLQDQYVHI